MPRLSILCLGSLLCVCLLGACVDDGAVEPHAALQLMHEQADMLVVDVRTPEEFARQHYAQAINIPVDDIEARAHELPEDRPILLYCAVGKRAYRAQVLLWKLRPEVGPVLRIHGAPVYP